MTKYAQYSFDLQHTTTRTVIQQRLCMAAYEERHIAISREDDLLYSCTVPPLEGRVPSPQWGRACVAPHHQQHDVSC
jgi:hypothetical protein